METCALDTPFLISITTQLKGTKKISLSLSQNTLIHSVLKMHRQSLSSPNSKLHSPHGGLLTTPTNNNNSDLTPGDSLLAAGNDVDELRKSLKPQKSSEKLIHIIPMLVVFCFLVLYLSSHDPSQKEVTSFSGFKRSSKPIDIEISSEIDDFGGLLEMENNDVLAIRSMRNLQEIDKNQSQQHNQVHRKIGDF